MAGRVPRMSIWRRSTAICPAPGSNTSITTNSGPGVVTSLRRTRCGTSIDTSTRSNKSGTALGLTRENFVLYGQSWGGILAIEYALHHQRNLRGLVISNMMASAPAYNAYAREVLMPPMDQQALAEIQALEAAGDTANPRFQELLMEQHYVHHVLRMPVEAWPDPVLRGFSHINPAIYVRMQGPSELGIAADATLASWDRFDDLARIEVPALVIGAQHDTMDPRASSGDGPSIAPRRVPALSRRQPPRHVRRCRGLLRGPDRFPAATPRLTKAGRWWPSPARGTHQ